MSDIEGAPIVNSLVGDPTLNPVTYTKGSEVMSVIVNLVMGTSIAFSVIALVMAGIKHTASGGDIKAVQQSRQYFTMGVVSFIITIASFSIKAILLGALGVQNADLTAPVSPSF